MTLSYSLKITLSICKAARKLRRPVSRRADGCRTQQKKPALWAGFFLPYSEITSLRRPWRRGPEQEWLQAQQQERPQQERPQQERPQQEWRQAQQQERPQQEPALLE
jgi:hypothetical protein